MITIEYVDNEANKANTSPTEKQREAGNYMKGHISVKGMRIAIENPKGSKRYYGDGTKYNVMNNHYGYFNITKGKDGDAVDVFLGPDIEDFDRVFCIDQLKADGTFDETKVMLGFSSKEEAKDAYMSNYEPDWKGFGDITSVSVKDFKKWLYRGRKQRQPFADYVYIQKKKIDEMKKVIKLNEADIMKAVKNAVKKTIKEDYTTNDVADMLGAYDGHDGPTNDGYDWNDQVYYKALKIMRNFEFDGDEAIDAIENAINNCNDMVARMSPAEASVEIAKEAMKMIDPEYYQEEVEWQLNEKRVIKLSESDIHRIVKNAVKRIMNESKMVNSLDNPRHDPADDADLDYQYEMWKASHPSEKDWDDAFSAAPENDEPALIDDEMSADFGKNRSYPFDADDEGAGSSRDYLGGFEYGKNLVAKGRVPAGLVAELNKKEDEGTISSYETGILDAIDEG